MARTPMKLPGISDADMARAKLDMEQQEREALRPLLERASIAAMSAILANPVAWAELKTEAAINKTPVLDGLAQASCNAAEALIREIGDRSKIVMRGDRA